MVKFSSSYHVQAKTFFLFSLRMIGYFLQSFHLVSSNSLSNNSLCKVKILYIFSKSTSKYFYKYEKNIYNTIFFLLLLLCVDDKKRKKNKNLDGSY